MLEMRAYVCPNCSATSGVNSPAMSHSELAGVETWGVCWSCAGEFQLTVDRRQNLDIEQAFAATRSPIVSNLVFRMWCLRPR